MVRSPRAARATRRCGRRRGADGAHGRHRHPDDPCPGRRALGPLRNVVVARRTLLKGEIVGRDDVGVLARHVGQEPNDVLTDPARGNRTRDHGRRRARCTTATCQRERGSRRNERRAQRRRARRSRWSTPAAWCRKSVRSSTCTRRSVRRRTRATPTLTTTAQRSWRAVPGCYVSTIPRPTSRAWTRHRRRRTRASCSSSRRRKTADIASAVAGGVMTVAIAPVEDAVLRRPLAIAAACVGVIAFALMLAAPAASASTVHLTPAQTRAARR